MEIESYPTIEAYYDAHEPARISAESDYGVWWRDDDGGLWRVSYVHNTGHVYAICQTSGGARTQILRIGGENMISVCANDGDRAGPVVIIATLEACAETALEGWADVCGGQGSLRWVFERLAPVLP